MSAGKTVSAAGLAAALFASVALPRTASANVIGTLQASFDDSVRGGGVVAEGASFAGRADGAANTSAAITIAGIPPGSTVQRALLYWQIAGASDTTALINSVGVTGTQIGVAGDTCWGNGDSFAFRADVTAEVTGNGVYFIEGLPSSGVPGPPDTSGVALVVVYQDLASPVVRRVMIHDGAISTDGQGELVTDTFSGVAGTLASSGRFHIVVGDGQPFPDGDLVFNGVTLATDPFSGSDGSLMDVNSYDVTIPAGLPEATWSISPASDCLLFETAVLEFDDTSVCGDGLITGTETCDQGNTTNGDGCSAQCAVEPGWQCSGQPSICVPGADLSVTKDDGQTTAIPGQGVTYTIVVHNAGPTNVMGATVTDIVPASLSGVSWTCSPGAGATCTPAGSGNINDTLNLAAGSSVIYTLTGTLDPSATGLLSNTATVTGPPGIGDPDSTNNSATDTDTVPGLNYFTIPPCRVVDTRGGAPIGGPVLQAQQTRTLAVAGNCAIPASAKAISINLAVTQPTATGNVRLFPAGQPVPTISSINYATGQTRGNNSVVPLSALGQMAAFVGQPAGTTVHLIIDVNGYFE